MINLNVFGPLEIKKNKAGKSYTIENSNIKNFWEDYMEFSEKQGIYVFALKAGKGFTPWYVGKTNNSFNNECFHSSKLVKYNNLIMKRKGKPVLFFICKEGNRIVMNQYILKQMEEFFIQCGFSRNKNLLNIIGKPKYHWSVKGVINTTQGQPERAAKLFNKCLGLRN
jgi:hypothetical protein